MDEPGKQTAREPGAPFPEGALDPELVALRRPRAQISVFLSASIVGLCLYLLAVLAADWAFSRQDSAPLSFDSVEALLAAVDLENRLVEVRAVPDRTFTAHVSTGTYGVAGFRANPALDSSDRLWLYGDSNPWTSTAVSETYQGRLRRLRDLPFAEPLSDFVGQAPPSPRYVTTDALRSALTSSATSIAAPGGGKFEWRADTPISVTQRIDGQAQLWVAKTGELPTADAWTKALVAANVLTATRDPVRENDVGALFVVPAPGDIDGLKRQLTAAKLYSVKVEPIDKIHRATRGQVSGTAAGLTVDGALIPWPQILGGTVAVKHSITPNALILLTNERPEQYWYVSLLGALLAVLALLFSWALTRTLREATRANQKAAPAN